MMAGISSPARPWFRLRLADERANEDPGARAWLDEVQQRMLHVFAKSNLYNCLHTLYGELGVFGTAALWVDEDEEDVVRGYTLTAGEYWLASSQPPGGGHALPLDVVDGAPDRRHVRPRQRQRRRGGRLRYGQLDLEYEIVHAIEPNPNAAAHRGEAMDDPWRGHLAGRLPLRSVWFERATQGDDAAAAASRATRNRPCMAPRWERRRHRELGQRAGLGGAG